MFYEPELLFLRETLKKCRVQSLIADLSESLRKRQDFHLHSFLESHIDTSKPLRDILPPIKPAVIYRIRDPLFCRYIFLLLPDLPREAILVIGPYLPSPPTQQQILERAEKNSIPPAQQKELEKFYGSVPILPETSHLFVMLETFGERLWGSNGFTLEDVNQGTLGTQGLLPKKTSSSDEKDMLWNMRNMELRYFYENELMDAVSRGQAHKADLLFGSFSSSSFEQRLSDPVRNVKNYCIIMNTLLRKAAEKGGVHPVYLDSASSAFAAKIEQLDCLESATPLITEMFRSYCRLVRKHSMKDYSPTVQKVIACIDSDLTGNLSLNTFSQALNISGSYLSTIFKKETGQTLTDYINHRRVSHAKHLLETTRLQVQTIAQHCGIMDVHYFSKVFKKITGQTPKEYRESLNR